jgi:hypothetical protein
LAIVKNTTTKQDFFDQLRLLYKDNYEAFARDILQIDLSDQQKDLIERAIEPDARLQL